MIDSGGINSVNSSNILKNTNKTKLNKKTEPNTNDESLFKSENLEKSAEIKKYLNKADLIPEVRQEMVNHFRELIRNNAYDIDEAKIANKLLG